MAGEYFPHLDLSENLAAQRIPLIANMPSPWAALAQAIGGGAMSVGQHFAGVREKSIDTNALMGILQQMHGSGSQGGNSGGGGLPMGGFGGGGASRARSFYNSEFGASDNDPLGIL
jgi:uncharacterized membrane protein YgcG